MSDLLIKGGNALSGEITPSGNKNAILPIMCAALLTKKTVTLRNVPDLTDVWKLVETMKTLGSKIDWNQEKCVMNIQNDEICLDAFDGSLPMGMRSAVLLLAPLTCRMEELSVASAIGGCSLGIREIDTHLHVFEALGAKVETSNGNIFIKIKDRFTGGSHWADYMSVTTTENFIMAAVCAKGKSVMNNAASEPHVQDLCNFLVELGAEINGIGSSRLVINGVDELGGADYTIVSDHHEITTFLALGAMTGGRVEVKNAIPEHFGLIVQSFDKLGVKIEYEKDTAIVDKKQILKVKDPYTRNFIPKVEAAPWPYFPQDLHPLMMALATKAEGHMMFWNKVYEGANMWVPELLKFGVKLVLCDPHRVLIWGGLPLKSAVVDAPDIIRATVALFMIAQSIDGESLVRNADPIKRAHPRFVEKMVSLGADVTWVN